MTESGMSQLQAIPVESILRQELAVEDALLGSIEPILGYLLTNHDQALFSDEIVSRVRGMSVDLAQQMLSVLAEVMDSSEMHAFPDEAIGTLSEALIGDRDIACHCHALAVEAQLTSRLERQHGIDPVLSPLLQALIASDDAQVASLAMSALTAHARFIQRQRRMELVLSDLPADPFHRAVEKFSQFAESVSAEPAAIAVGRLRQNYDERVCRPALLERLVNETGNGVRAALFVSHAGVAIFLSALASIAKQPRDTVILSTNEQQSARLTLALLAAGLKHTQVEQQLMYFNPEITLPEDFSMLGADRAASLLAESDCAVRG
ncbi:hypothetical protein [Tsuneonella suprasediminis]|uniref:hypothetical protein n=1 Tax=Tsuneonella suprasediminis TaxID=2306996 RepID=UPI002F92DB3D